MTAADDRCSGCRKTTAVVQSGGDFRPDYSAVADLFFAHPCKCLCLVLSDQLHAPSCADAVCCSELPRHAQCRAQSTNHYSSQGPDGDESMQLCDMPTSLFSQIKQSIQTMATAFDASSKIYAPLYRQVFVLLWWLLDGCFLCRLLRLYLKGCQPASNR